MATTASRPQGGGRDLRARAKQCAAALAAHDHMLAANPLDSDSRRKIADLLLRAGRRAGAVEVYRALAMHDVRSGHLLPAIVGCKVLESLGEQQPTTSWRRWRRLYAHGSPTLAKFAARQAPVDLDASIAPPDLGQRRDRPARSRPGARRARSTCPCSSQYPEQFLPRAVLLRAAGGGVRDRRSAR